MKRLSVYGFCFVLLVSAMACTLLSCGPIKTTLAMKDVEEILKEARQQDAPQKTASVYYYYAAEQYLIKAKRTHGYSDFDDSEQFAEKARDLAQKALEKAKTGKKRVHEPDISEKPEKRKQKKSEK